MAPGYRRLELDYPLDITDVAPHLIGCAVDFGLDMIDVWPGDRKMTDGQEDPEGKHYSMFNYKGRAKFLNSRSAGKKVIMGITDYEIFQNRTSCGRRFNRRHFFVLGNPTFVSKIIEVFKGVFAPTLWRDDVPLTEVRMTWPMVPPGTVITKMSLAAAEELAAPTLPMVLLRPSVTDSGASESATLAPDPAAAPAPAPPESATDSGASALASASATPSAALAPAPPESVTDSGALALALAPEPAGVKRCAELESSEHELRKGQLKKARKADLAELGVEVEMDEESGNITFKRRRTTHSGAGLHYRLVTGPASASATPAPDPAAAPAPATQESVPDSGAFPIVVSRHLPGVVPRPASASATPAPDPAAAPAPAAVPGAIPVRHTPAPDPAAVPAAGVAGNLPGKLANTHPDDQKELIDVVTESMRRNVGQGGSPGTGSGLNLKSVILAASEMDVVDWGGESDDEEADSEEGNYGALTTGVTDDQFGDNRVPTEANWGLDTLPETVSMSEMQILVRQRPRSAPEEPRMGTSLVRMLAWVLGIRRRVLERHGLSPAPGSVVILGKYYKEAYELLLTDMTKVIRKVKQTPVAQQNIGDAEFAEDKATHTHIHTYTHAHTYTYTHTYINAYIHTNKQTDRQTHRQTCRN